MQALRHILTGTLGDSFLLTASPTSRATMVGQFKRDLAWLAGVAAAGPAPVRPSSELSGLAQAGVLG